MQCDEVSASNWFSDLIDSHITPWGIKWIFAMVILVVNRKSTIYQLTLLLREDIFSKGRKFEWRLVIVNVIELFLWIDPEYFCIYPFLGDIRLMQFWAIQSRAMCRARKMGFSFVKLLSFLLHFSRRYYCLSAERHFESKNRNSATIETQFFRTLEIVVHTMPLFPSWAIFWGN